MKLITHHSSLTTGANRRRGLPSVALAKEGQIFVILLILLFVTTLLLLSMYSRIAQYIISSRGSLTADQTTALADAGVDTAINKINNPNNYPGYTGETLILLTGQVQISISGTSSPKTVTSEGCIPNCTSPTAKRKVTAQVTITTTNYNFPYAVHGTQPGSTNTAVTLSSSTVTGNVHSNSKVSCTSTTVNGIVEYLTGTTQPSCGTTKTPSITIDPDPKIAQDLAGWKTAAAANTQNCSGTYIINSSVTIGPRKYTCNVQLEAGADVSLSGPIYIEGDFNVYNATANISINSSLGSCGTVIVVGGRINNINDFYIGLFRITGTTLQPVTSYPLIISEYSDASGNAILLKGGAPINMEAIFYTPNKNFLTPGIAGAGGTPLITGAVVGSTVTMNNTTITYGGAASLQPAKFCGLNNVWTVVRGTYKISK